MTTKRDAYKHTPRTSTVASSLTISFGHLQDFQVSKTRRMKTPFLYVVTLCFPPYARLDVAASPLAARRGLSCV